MIPTFPDFKNIELADRPAVKRITKKFAPYSDFNFISILSWGYNENIQISKLHHNLVIRFKDYNSSKKFYSLIGLHMLQESIVELLLWQKKTYKKITPYVKLIPLEMLQSIDERILSIQEEIDHYDYIYELNKLINLSGSAYKKKRNLVKKFNATFSSEVYIKRINLHKKDIHPAILNVFILWTKIKHKKKHQWINEYSALKNLLDNAKHLKLISYGLFLKNRFVGFSIGEKLDDTYTIIHYEKISVLEAGISEYFLHTLAKMFKKAGFSFLNYQQDLGIDGLRVKKTLLRPSFFLKKYSISLRDEN